jgi:hypothetical protein
MGGVWNWLRIVSNLSGFDISGIEPSGYATTISMLAKVYVNIDPLVNSVKVDQFIINTGCTLIIQLWGLLKILYMIHW